VENVASITQGRAGVSTGLTAFGKFSVSKLVRFLIRKGSSVRMERMDVEKRRRAIV